MSHQHFTEEQLQTLALNRHQNSDCPHCQAQLSAYRLLYDHIAETEVAVPELDSIILDHLPDYRASEPEDNRLKYLVLVAGLLLLSFGAAALWGAIHWIFNDIKPLLIMMGVALFSGVLLLQLGELYNNYRKKLSALQPDMFSTVSS